MLRHLLVLFCGAMLPLAAWELPSEYELAAAYGKEPMLSIATAGIPLPPSRREVAGIRYGRQAGAIKQALMYQISHAKAERRRISLDNYRATAVLARRTGAPVLFSHYQDLLAGNTLTSREEYHVSQALNLLEQEVYGIDVLQIRLLSESLSLPVADHCAYMMKLPIASLCERVPVEAPPRDRLLADWQMMSEVLADINQLLEKVTDRASADAAAASMLELLPLWSTTQHTRSHMDRIINLSEAEQKGMETLNAAYAAIVRTRRALVERKWYDSPYLRFVDELFR